MAGGTHGVLLFCAERNSLSGLGLVPNPLIAGILGGPVDHLTTMALPPFPIERHWSWYGCGFVRKENRLKHTAFRCVRGRNPAGRGLSA